MTSEVLTVPVEEFSRDVSRLVERVIREGKPVVVETAAGERVVLKPMRSSKRRSQKKTEADYQAFLSSAGGWKDLVDTEKLKEDIYASRKISTRPAIEL